MSDDELTPTLDELKAQAKQRWNANAAARFKQHKELEEKIAAMPDVLHAPSPTEAWSHPAIVCPSCHNVSFSVLRWGCLNGLRHKAELQCRACQTVGTWEWGESRWVS